MPVDPLDDRWWSEEIPRMDRAGLYFAEVCAFRWCAGCGAWFRVQPGAWRPKIHCSPKCRFLVFDIMRAPDRRWNNKTHVEPVLSLGGWLAADFLFRDGRRPQSGAWTEAGFRWFCPFPHRRDPWGKAETPKTMLRRWHVRGGLRWRVARADFCAAVLGRGVLLQWQGRVKKWLPTGYEQVPFKGIDLDRLKEELTGTRGTINRQRLTGIQLRIAGAGRRADLALNESPPKDPAPAPAIQAGDLVVANERPPWADRRTTCKCGSYWQGYHYGGCGWLDVAGPIQIMPGEEHLLEEEKEREPTSLFRRAS